MVVNVGMWLERFVIVVTSLHRDFLPSSWGMYYPTIWDWMTFVGTIGLFVTLFFLFIRVLPMISIFEMRTMVPEAKVTRVGGRTDDHRTRAAAGDLRPDGRVRRSDGAGRRPPSGPTSAGYREDRRLLAVPDRRGLAKRSDCDDTRLSKIVLAGGITGLLAGFGLQDWVHVIAYPMNIAGKPLNQLAAFIPVTFELTILFAAIAGGARHDRAERAAACRITRCSTWRASSAASQDKFFLRDRGDRPEVRSRCRPSTSSRGSMPSEVNEVEA